jgi:hypothetical protein
MCDMLRVLVKVTLMAYLVGGVRVHGPAQSDIDNPAVRKVAWFSYLDGNDIRERWRPGAPDRFRLSTTANTRSRFAPTNHPGESESRRAPTSSRVRSGRPTSRKVEINDLLAPWRWQKSETKTERQRLDQFRDLLTQSGWGRGAPQGKILHSREFSYWVAAGCRRRPVPFRTPGSMPRAISRRSSSQIFLLAHARPAWRSGKPFQVLPVDRPRPDGRASAPSHIFSSLTVSGERELAALVNGLLSAHLIQWSLASRPELTQHSSWLIPGPRATIF